MSTIYALEHLWFLTKAVVSLGGQDLSTPSFLELTQPDTAKKDDRTANEIFADIDRQLTIIIAREEEKPHD